MHPVNLPGSATVTFGQRPLMTAPPGFDAKTINDKITLMTSATENLKPQPSQPIMTLSTSATARIRAKRAISRMANAISDRFSPRGRGNNQGNDQDNNHGNISEPFQATMSVPRHWQTSMPLGLSKNACQVTSAERRQKEDENLSNPQVLMGFGKEIRRKPVASPAPLQSPRPVSPGSSDIDPFSDSHVSNRTPTDFEMRLGNTSGVSSVPEVTPRLPTRNPFETEAVLEWPIEAFLTTPPLASSTPRSKRTAAQVIEESVVDPALIFSDTRRPRYSLTTDPCAANPSSSSSHGLRSIPHGSTSISGVSMKKHPSPSKDYLEMLEGQLGKYAADRYASVTKEDEDELARSSARSAALETLASRDQNRPIFDDSAEEDDALDGPGESPSAKTSKAKRRISTSVQTQGSSISRRTIVPHGAGTAMHTTTRVAAPQPYTVQSDAEETDELQWDTPRLNDNRRNRTRHRVRGGIRNHLYDEGRNSSSAGMA